MTVKKDSVYVQVVATVVVNGEKDETGVTLCWVDEDVRTDPCRRKIDHTLYDSFMAVGLHTSSIVGEKLGLAPGKLKTLKDLTEHDLSFLADTESDLDEPLSDKDK
jgi:hypothetical protein